VLVLGATGSSGQMSVQVAKLLGAEQVIAVGRDPQRLAVCRDLGADTVVRLGESPVLGEVAADIPAAALRALPLQIVGSGQGSVSTRDVLSELPAIAEAVGSGALRIDAREMPLTDVATAWQDADDAARIVLTP
jgi:threonine dehydrogenase-like Zn-dependent dehydrogenase